MTVTFDSRTEAKQFASLAVHYAKIPGRGFCSWAAIGNRTRIEGSTNPSVNRYTIAASVLCGMSLVRGRDCRYRLQRASYTYFFRKSTVVLLLFRCGATLFEIMDQEALLVTLFFSFMLAAGIGFYLARFFF